MCKNMSVAKMIMLLWMWAIKEKKRKIRNEIIYIKFGVTPIEDEMRESKLRLGQVRKRLIETQVRQVDEMKEICRERD